MHMEDARFTHALHMHKQIFVSSQRRTVSSIKHKIYFFYASCRQLQTHYCINVIILVQGLRSVGPSSARPSLVTLHLTQCFSAVASVL